MKFEITKENIQEAKRNNYNSGDYVKYVDLTDTTKEIILDELRNEVLEEGLKETHSDLINRDSGGLIDYVSTYANLINHAKKNGSIGLLGKKFEYDEEANDLLNVETDESLEDYLNSLASDKINDITIILKK